MTIKLLFHIQTVKQIKWLKWECIGKIALEIERKIYK